MKIFFNILIAVLLPAQLWGAASLQTGSTQVVKKPGMAAPVAVVQEGSFMDFHTHTYCSDGWSIPEHQIKLAAGDAKFFLPKAAGPRIKYMAVTDHDTMDCVARAQQFAAKKYPDMHVIAGIEISANDNTHILGLNVDSASAGVKKISEDARKNRVERMRNYVKELNKMGAKITERDVMMPKLASEYRGDGKSTAAIANMTDEQILSEVHGMMMRPDIAKALIAGGYAKDNREAFDRWLNKANVPGDSLDIKTTIDAIHAAGGLAILAHPYTIYKYGGNSQTYGDQTFSNSDPIAMFEAIAKAMLEAGLDGFEAYKPNWQKYPADFNRIKALADKWKESSGKELVLSGGSDYHGQIGIGPQTMMKETFPIEAQQKLLKALHLN